MLTIFRRIRKGLLDLSQTRKYLLYAIGEIALVVIGILIALQINNWNENRQSQKFELQLLIELRNTLIADYGLTKKTIDGNRRAVSSCKLLLIYLEDNLPYHDSLRKHFIWANGWWAHLVINRAYENAKKHGLEFIKDDTLRDDLSGFYEYRVLFNATRDERNSDYHFNTVIPIITELFESSTRYDKSEGISPYDFDVLKKNANYKHILRTNMGRRQNDDRWINDNLKAMKGLEELLQQEINNK